MKNRRMMTRRRIKAGWRALAALSLAISAWGLSLAGCESSEKEGRESHAPVRIVASIPPLAGLARELAPAGVEVKSVMPAGGSPHVFMLLPSDIAGLARADIVVTVGLGLEPGVERALRARRREGRVELVFADVAGIDVAQESENDHSGEHAHDHQNVDPHLWLDPVLVRAFVPALRSAIESVFEARGELDDDILAQLKEREQAALNVVDEIDAAYNEQLAPFAGRAIVTHHESLGRLAARYGLEIAAVLRPAEGAEPTPGAIMDVVKAIEERGARVIFVEPQFDEAQAQRIVDLTGVGVERIDPIGAGDWAAMMRNNLEALVRGLSQGEGGNKE